MSLETSLFASHARSAPITFECALDCKVGAYSLQEGDGIKAMRDWSSLYNVYVEWAEGPIGRLTGKDVNKLAGYDVIRCSCLDPVHPGDDPNCQVHGGVG
jgi:hypothetical protein